MAKNRLEVTTTGYLYNIRNGELKEYHGIILGDDYEKQYPYSLPHNKSYFHIMNERGRIVKTTECSIYEGEFCNGNVWMRESDIRGAAQVFIEHEEKQIFELGQKIKNCRSLVNTLRSI